MTVARYFALSQGWTATLNPDSGCIVIFRWGHVSGEAWLEEGRLSGVRILVRGSRRELPSVFPTGELEEALRRPE